MKRYIKSANTTELSDEEIIDQYIKHLHTDAGTKELEDFLGYRLSRNESKEDIDALIDDEVYAISNKFLLDYFALPWYETKGREIHVGDYVRTPRFLNVKIEEVFDNEEDCRNAGYIESTDYRGYEYGVLGKSIDEYHMEFAAYKK